MAHDSAPSWLQQKRLVLGLSQEDVARSVGVTKSHVSGLENGRIRRPADKLLKDLARVLRVKPELVLASLGALPPDVIAGLQARPEKIYEIRDLLKR